MLNVLLKKNDDKKTIKYWDNSLTRKLIYLYKISPIIALKDSFIRNGFLREQFKHYDALAIALKILEVIIDNMGPFEGVTKKELFEEIEPLLILMDQAKRVKNITKNDHYKMLEYILEKLVRQKSKKGIRLEFTDYSEYPPLKREIAFRLITYRTYDNEKVVLYAEPEAVNFFIQMLDVDLEDQQQAYLKILDRQIERGDYESAVEVAKNNYRLTIQYELKITNIIHKTKRNLLGIDWSHEIPTELRKAMHHINDCIKEQDLQNRKINIQLKNIEEEYFKREILLKLKEILEKSRDKLLPLQNKINKARTTFLDEQWLQELTLQKTNKISIESDLFDLILRLEAHQIQERFSDFTSFFTGLNVPKLVTYNQLVSFLIQKIDRIKTPESEIKKEEKIYRLTELIFYPINLKMEVVVFIKDHLSHRDHTTFDDLIQDALKIGKSVYFCNYLKLLVLGRFANNAFEKGLFEEQMQVDLLKTDLNNSLFEGNNFQIQFKR